MKITVKSDHLGPLILLISSYQEGQPPQGLMFEPSLTSGVLTRLSKIKSIAVNKNAPIKEVLEAIGTRNEITPESYGAPQSENFEAFMKESAEVLVAPVELEFEPVSASFIDNIVISGSKIPDWAKNNPEYLSELFDIIKGEYIFPEELKTTKTEPEQ